MYCTYWLQCQQNLQHFNQTVGILQCTACGIQLASWPTKPTNWCALKWTTGNTFVICHNISSYNIYILYIYKYIFYVLVLLYVRRTVPIWFNLYTHTPTSQKNIPINIRGKKTAAFGSPQKKLKNTRNLENKQRKNNLFFQQLPPSCCGQRPAWSLAWCACKRSVFQATKPRTPRRQKAISHRIRGTGIFTYIYHKHQPFMSVNIPVPWILWVWDMENFSESQSCRLEAPKRTDTTCGCWRMLAMILKVTRWSTCCCSNYMMRLWPHGVLW